MTRITSLLTKEVWRWKFILPKTIIIVSVVVLLVFYGMDYEDVANGDIILYMQDYGFDPPGINVLLDGLEVFRSGCLINFYRWPVQNP